MLKIKRLELKNFRSFNNLEINFPNSGAVLLNGDSGAGKTSIFLAIAYVLDILPVGFSAKGFQKWSEDEGFQVTCWLDKDGEEIVLSRGSTSSIKTPEGVVSGAKAYSESLESVLGIPTTVLGSMVYRPQRQPGMFLSMTSGEKTDFLTTILGLEKIETEIEESKKRQNALEKEIDGLNGSIVGVAAALSIASEYKPSFLNEEMLRDDIQEAEKAVTELATQLARVASELQQKEEKLISELSSKKEEIYNKIRALEEQAADNKKTLDSKYEQSKGLEEAKRKFISIENKFEQNKKDILSLSKSIEKLSRNVCQTCEQSWPEALKQKQLLEIQLQAATIENEKFNGLEVLKQRNEDKIAAASVELATIKNFVRQIESEIKKQNEELFLLQQGVVDTELKNKKASTGEKLERAKATLNSVVTAFKVAQQKNSSEAEKIKENSDKAATLKSKKQELEKESQCRLLILNEEKDFSGSVGRDGFLNTYFGDILSHVAVETNEMLKTLPNVSGVTVTFKPESSKSGKRSVVTDIYVDGNPSDLRSGLSGGMQAVVEQATDIALSKVIQQRMGKSPGFLMLDETLYGFGAQTKEAMLDLIARFASDKLVLIVDHSAEAGEMFAQVIDIKKENGVSYKA